MRLGRTGAACTTAASRIAADTIMSNCFQGRLVRFTYLVCPSQAMQRDMKGWQRKCDDIIPGHVGFIHGGVGPSLARPVRRERG